MEDFTFSDDPELQRLNAQVLADPEDSEAWEKLVSAAVAQEGGLHRNSSPQAIANMRNVYDRFLARFPLFFGYWKKYAELEFNIAGTEVADMVYERGVASIGASVDLWASYCSFKVETNHDAEAIRELFERAAASIGLDFHAHEFWDKYLEFEERMESKSAIFAILGRLTVIPLHQYARYFERYRSMATNRPIEELGPESIISQMRRDIALENGQKQMKKTDIEREVRSKFDAAYIATFNVTQAEVTKRWPYEQEIKRPYYHVAELDEAQLTNWDKYLDFEDNQGQPKDNYDRTKFLYERCLVTCANYDKYWYRYARWMMGQEHLTKGVRAEEVRNIYNRASSIFVPIARPDIRLSYARFEESLGDADISIAIHESILMKLPGHLETIISLGNVYRRQYGVDAALPVLHSYITNQETDRFTRGALVAELARLAWKVKGDPENARLMFVGQQQHFRDSKKFWFDWFNFERDQPTSEQDEPQRYDRIKQVFNDIRHKSELSPTDIKELSVYYFEYLLERGGENAMEELMELDQGINGPSSVASGRLGQGTAATRQPVDTETGKSSHAANGAHTR